MTAICDSCHKGCQLFSHTDVIRQLSDGQIGNVDRHVQDVHVLGASTTLPRIRNTWTFVNTTTIAYQQNLEAQADFWLV